MGWAELAGQEKVKDEVEVAISADTHKKRIEEYLFYKQKAAEFADRAKLLLSHLTDSVSLEEGEEFTVNTKFGPVVMEGRSTFHCSAVKMAELVDKIYKGGDVPDYIKTKYSVTRKTFEALDSDQRNYFYEAVTYKKAQHKVHG